MKLFGSDTSPVPQLNPLGRVPTLVLDDGTVVFDSPVICEYVDAPADRQDPAPLALHGTAITRALALAASQLGKRDWRGQHPDLAAWAAGC